MQNCSKKQSIEKTVADRWVRRSHQMGGEFTITFLHDLKIKLNSLLNPEVDVRADKRELQDRLPSLAQRLGKGSFNIQIQWRKFPTFLSFSSL